MVTNMVTDINTKEEPNTGLTHSLTQTHASTRASTQLNVHRLTHTSDFTRYYCQGHVNTAQQSVEEHVRLTSNINYLQYRSQANVLEY
uniref:Uncharacterized protein n=1 Tax=Anguilla anguilla TaxID=7936 RepID=A0A0E9V1R6_ANGAN